ncbi:MAG: hypothetical protein EON60_00540 [Alphaproteobacteria bacterium]|nr:MAG: hypothetical protein EON60_00540 [Alphaproteobacteria bacterium]
MKKSILGFVSALALVAAASVAHADADIKIYGANAKPVVAGQLNVGTNTNVSVGANVGVKLK